MDSDDFGWAKPVQIFTQHLLDSHNIVHLTYWGAHLLIAESDLMEAIAQSSFLPEETKPTAQTRAEALLRVRAAQKEKEEDFPLLHGHTLMGIWGALEAFVEDLCVSYMQSYPAVLDEPGLEKINIPFSEYRRLSEIEKLRYLVSEVQQKKRTGLRAGVKVFEDLLASLGLDGEVHPHIRDVLYEAQQLRNVLAHRGGVADQKLCEACPKLGLSVGERVSVSRETLVKISNAMRAYCMTIMNRIFVLHGTSASTSHPGMPAELKGTLNVQYPNPSRTGDKWKAVK